MSRPLEPEKKKELLEKCFAAAIEVGLDFSINQIAKRIGSSGRMLIYHFGSKQELERQIIRCLEMRLRQKLWSFPNIVLETDCLAKPLLEMWKHLTSPQVYGLLKLTMELNQRAIGGDLETRLFLERESEQWIDSLSKLTNNKNIALCIFYLFQGAILDYLTTGNVQRGEQSIKAFTENLSKLTP